MRAYPETEGMEEREKSLEEQLEYHKKLNEITNRIHSASDINDILLNLQTQILGLFEADRITVYVVDGTRKEIVSRFKTGEEVKEIRLPIDHTSIAGYSAASARMVNIQNVYNPEELRAITPELRFDGTWDQKTGYRTAQVLAAPICYQRYLMGVVQLINKQHGDRFTKEDQSAIQDIAKVLAVAFYKNSRAARTRRPTKFDYLVANNIISGEDLTRAMEKARKDNRTVESVLMSEFDVSKERIGKSLAAFYHTRFIAYDDRMVIPGHLLKGLKVGFLKRNLFVPVEQSGRKVVVAMEDPAHLPARDAIKRSIRADGFEYCVSLREDIHRMIDHFFGLNGMETLAGTGSIEEILGQLESPEAYEEEDLDITEEDSAIVQLVNKVIIDAYKRGASDIHIEPRQGRANAVIRIRVDGDCQVYQTIPCNYKRAVVSRIKIMADLDIAERRLPQDGKIKLRKFAPLDIELRVSSVPTYGGQEDVVMRILSSADPMPLEDMGMSERNYRVFTDMIEKPYGMVLVVGPTGSGKTTTLHAALRSINKPETKIWTAEDPVEITQDGLRQVQVYPKIGLDFARAMRAFLRADPDVVMVGEMRDRETVATGIEASLTGHLVLSTLHTNSAVETVTRLLDMGMDPFNFADALLGVVAQRLVKTLCRDCREAYHPSQEEFDALARAYGEGFENLGVQYSDELTLYRAKGCSKCSNTGYRGRTGIHEILVATDDIKGIIQTRTGMEALRAKAAQEGMTTLMQDGIRKILLGQTDLMQVRKVCMK